MIVFKLYNRLQYQSLSRFLYLHYSGMELGRWSLSVVRREWKDLKRLTVLRHG